MEIDPAVSLSHDKESNLQIGSYSNCESPYDKSSSLRMFTYKHSYALILVSRKNGCLSLDWLYG